MFKTIVLLIVVTAICFYEVPKMRKKQMKKELTIFSLLLSVATIIYLLELNGVDIPNPLQALRAIFSPIGLGIEALFKS